MAHLAHCAANLKHTSFLTLVDLNSFIKKRSFFWKYFFTSAKFSQNPCLTFVGNNASYKD